MPFYANDANFLIAKKQEILGELEMAKHRIMQELSAVDNCTLAKLREILANYNKVELLITDKLNLFEKKCDSFISYAEKTGLNYETEIQAIKKLVEDFDKLSENLESADLSGLIKKVSNVSKALEDLKGATISKENLVDLEKRTEATLNKVEALESAIGAALTTADTALTAASGAVEKASEASEKVATLEYPTLSTERKQQLIDLINAYYTNRSIFDHTLNITRNVYADTGAYVDDTHIKCNCSLFLQLLWAGVDLSTFTGKLSTFSGDIVKAFDWGYYFNFVNRAAYGITKSDGSYYNFVKPNADSYEGSYSANSYYFAGSNNLYNQRFKDFMHSGDMARELKLAGCEVPLSQVQSGDILFFATVDTTDGESDGFEKTAYENINHCAIVTNVSNKANGDLTIMECTPYFGTATGGNVGTSKISSKDGAVKVRFAQLMDRFVMCARHPAAWGIASNVPEKFTTI